MKPFETAMLVEMQRHVQTALENTSEEKIWRGKNYCAVENVQVFAEEELVKHYIQLEQKVFCITVTDLRSLAFQSAELNNIPHSPEKDRNRWKEMARDDSHNKV